jgi:hypothetical protein
MRFEGNGGDLLGKRASRTLDAQRNMVDNGSISNGVKLGPNLAIQPFSTVIVTRARLSPKIADGFEPAAARLMLLSDISSKRGVSSHTQCACGSKLSPAINRMNKKSRAGRKTTGLDTAC